MHKKSDQFAAEYFINAIPTIKAEIFQRQRDIDKVVVWLTALSAAAVGLVLTSSDKLAVSDPIYLKIAMVLFVSCILSGAIFRSLVYVFEGMQARLLLGFEGFCYGYTSGIKGPGDLPEEATKAQIAESLKDDMGLDYDHWLQHDYLDDQFWKELYEGWAAHWKKWEVQGLKDIGRAYAPVINKLPSETESMLLPSPEPIATSKTYSALKWSCFVSYGLNLILFFLAVLSLVIGYVTS